MPSVGRQRATGSAAGRVKEKVEPSPGVDSTRIVPPCRSTIFLTTARPMPVPPYASWVRSRPNERTTAPGPGMATTAALRFTARAVPR